MGKKQKVFGAGLSKTATTSLSAALEVLGYKTKHFPIRSINYENGELSIDMDVLEKYDACTDLPIARFYKKIYKRFPGAKFILTLRDMENWLDSCRRHFWPGQLFKGDNWINKLHYDLYGTIDYDREKYMKAYTRHKRGVLEFFEDKDDQLLVMNIPDGDRWDVLCEFLDEPVPDRKFPKRDCFYTKIFNVIDVPKYR